MKEIQQNMLAKPLVAENGEKEEQIKKGGHQPKKEKQILGGVVYSNKIYLEKIFNKFSFYCIIE
jgi:hypothetical protein